MRIVPVIGLLAGCNWVFGLGDTQPIPPDAQLPPRVFVTRQVLVSPDQLPELTPIAGLTMVKVGLLSQPTEFTMPMVGADGGFDLPPGIANQPTRVTFTVPGETFEREIVWTPADQSRYVLPIFGPVDRTPPPGNALISFTAPGQLGFSNPSVLTEGLWSRTSLGNPTATTPNPVVDDYNKSIPMGGPLGTLSTSDQVFLVDYQCGVCGPMMNTGLPNAIRGYAQSTLDLVAGTNSVSGTWQQPAATPMATLAQDTSGARVASALGNLVQGLQTVISTAVIPSIEMPGSILREDGGLAEPVMFAIANSQTGQFPDSVNPFVNDAMLPAVSAGRWETVRSVKSIPLSSGITAVQFPNDPVFGNTVTACVELPTVVTIEDPSTGAKPLDLGQGDFDPTVGKLMFTNTVPLVLKFVLSEMPDPRCAMNQLLTQDCVATVFGFGSTSLITKRVVDAVVTSPGMSIELDQSAFDANSDYVISITCKSGYERGAFAKGRFDAIQYPFSTSTVYVAAFSTM